MGEISVHFEDKNLQLGPADVSPRFCESADVHGRAPILHGRAFRQIW